MRTTSRISAALALLLATASAVVLGAAPASAAERVTIWTGPMGGLWSNAANWSNGLPATDAVSGVIVRFTTNTSSVMDIPNLTVDQINFTGTGNVIAASGSTVLGIKGDISQNNILDNAGGNTIAAPINLNATTSIFVKVDTGQLTISGDITGTANFRLISSGANGVTLSGANTYTSATVVTGGTLRLNNNSVDLAIQSSSQVDVGDGSGAAATLFLNQSAEIANTVPVNVLSDGTFNLNDRTETVGPLTVTQGAVQVGAGQLRLAGALTMSGGTVTGSGPLGLGGDATLTSAGASTATISAPLRLNGNRTATVNPGTLPIDASVTGVISDGSVASSSLTKAGTGTLSVDGSVPNTYTGGTNVEDGVLAPTGASTKVIPAGALTIGDATGPGGSAVLRLDNFSVIDNTTTVVINADGEFSNNTFSETVGSTGVNGGSVSITGGTYSSGPLTMVGGTISTNGSGVLAPQTVTATSDAGGTGAVINAATSLPAAASFTVDAGTAPELTVGGVIGGAATSVTKAGGGTLRLNADNTYVGTTNVDAGTLSVNGVQMTPFTVASGATLTGTGTVGSTTVAGTIAPALPTLTTGVLTFTPTGTLSVAMTSPDVASVPHVTAVGAVTIDPAATLAIAATAGATPAVGSVLSLIDNDGADAVSGQFANAAQGASVTSSLGEPFVISYVGGSGNDVVGTAAAVPPPPCTDTKRPTSKVAKLKLARTLVTVTGSSADVRCGSAAVPVKVQVAVGLRKGSTCTWVGVAKASSCTKVPAKAFRTAKGTKAFSLKVKGHFKPGTYVAYSRATDKAGNVQAFSAKAGKTGKLK